MERPLGSFERAAVVTGERSAFVVVVVMRLVGRLAVERVRSALDRLRREEPLLRARVAATATGPRFVCEGVTAIPLERTERRDDRRWLEVVEEELNRPLPAAPGPLARCRLLGGAPARGDGGRHELIVTLHHAIVDAASTAALMNRLLTLLAGGPAENELAAAPAEPTGRPPAEPPARPPTERPAEPPVEARLPAAVRGLRGRLGGAGFLARQVADELGFRLRRRTGRRPPVAESPRCRPLAVALDREETGSLVRATRRRRVTLNGALSAAMLGAVHRRLYDGASRPLRYLAFADLRPQLDPPLPAGELGCCIAMLRNTLGMRSGTGFWELASEITRQVDRAVRRGDRFHAYRFCETAMRATLRQRHERMAATALSYSGVAPLAPPAGALRLADCHAFVSNLDLGPEYTALARLMDGRLQLDVVYLDSDMNEALAKELAADVLDTLRAAAATEPARGGNR